MENLPRNFFAPKSDSKMRGREKRASLILSPSPAGVFRTHDRITSLLLDFTTPLRNDNLITGVARRGILVRPEKASVIPDYSVFCWCVLIDSAIRTKIEWLPWKITNQPAVAPLIH